MLFLLCNSMHVLVYTMHKKLLLRSPSYLHITQTVFILTVFVFSFHTKDYFYLFKYSYCLKYDIYYLLIYHYIPRIFKDIFSSISVYQRLSRYITLIKTFSVIYLLIKECDIILVTSFSNI